MYNGRFEIFIPGVIHRGGGGGIPQSFTEDLRIILHTLSVELLWFGVTFSSHTYVHTLTYDKQKSQEAASDKTFSNQVWWED